MHSFQTNVKPAILFCDTFCTPIISHKFWTVFEISKTDPTICGLTIMRNIKITFDPIYLPVKEILRKQTVYRNAHWNHTSINSKRNPTNNSNKFTNDKHTQCRKLLCFEKKNKAIITDGFSHVDDERKREWHVIENERKSLLLYHFLIRIFALSANFSYQRMYLRYADILWHDSVSWWFCLC